MSSPHLILRPAVARIVTGLLAGLVAMPCVAQTTRTNVVNANAPSVGAVLAVSPLEPDRREPSGDLHVTGTVTTRHNGPYLLQVRLASPFTTGNGPNAATHEVFVQLPGQTLGPLGTTAWVTVASGPGSASIVNPVAYLIRWAQRGPRNTQSATAIPLQYQVVPR